MFHLQVRQFPHNHCQFNLTEQDVRSLAELWVRGDWLVIGERKWSPQQAKVKVIEGPQIPAAQLSMGRGWRHVERHGEDVTQRVLGDASALLASAEVAAPAHLARGEDDPDASDLRSLLGGTHAAALLAAWRSAAARFPDRSPSECLAMAERQLDPAGSEPPR
jgi:hypothetical protein